MTDVLERESARDILISGLSDWVDLGFARQYESDEVGDVGPAELRGQTLGVFAALLDASLVVVGDLASPGFALALDPAATVARIRAEWDVPEEPPDGGYACWFGSPSTGRPSPGPCSTSSPEPPVSQ